MYLETTMPDLPRGTYSMMIFTDASVDGRDNSLRLGWKVGEWRGKWKYTFVESGSTIR
jgi:hypothetical protein